MNNTKINHTPGPWAIPYVDTLPNGFRAVRIDSLQPEGVDVIALLPIGSGDDLEINAIQEKNARLLHAAPEMYEMLSRLTAYVESFGTSNIVEHIHGIPVVNDVRALLAKIDGREVK